MQIQMLKSKIHRAEVTAASLDYEGSLGIDRDLMDRVGMLHNERVMCSHLANGERFETYALPAARGAGSIGLNVATSHLANPSDRLTIMSYTVMEEGLARKWEPRVIVLGEKNAVVHKRGL